MILDIINKTDIIHIMSKYIKKDRVEYFDWINKKYSFAIIVRLICYLNSPNYPGCQEALYEAVSGTENVTIRESDIVGLSSKRILAHC